MYYTTESRLITEVTLSQESNLESLRVKLIPGEVFVHGNVGGFLEAFMGYKDKTVVHLKGGHQIHYLHGWLS